MSTPIFRIFLTSLLLLVAYCSATHAQECADCVQRKSRLCAKECELVDPSESLRCQKECTAGYCMHRCQGKPELANSLFNKDCSDCLDQQFVLCDEACGPGNERTRAVCKLSCAEFRCKSSCGSNAKSLK
jgi:hypothetical protein